MSKQPPVVDVTDPVLARERVQKGAQLFDEKYGPRWPTHFVDEPIRGIGYTPQCTRCVADIASGLPNTEGWHSLNNEALNENQHLHDYGINLYTSIREDAQLRMAEEAALVQAWQAEIDRRLAAGVTV